MQADSPVRHPDKFFIDGRWTEPSSARKIQVTNSATEELFLTVAEAEEADVHGAVAAARNAFDRGPWPRMSHDERAKYMRAMAAELDKLAEPHARIWTTEAGALHGFTKARCAGISNDYLSYAALAETFPFQERHKPKSGGELALLVREPVGVVAAIVPWNAAPGAISSKVGPALIAGCTVIVKVSPEAPGAAYILAEACEAAGFPPGVVNILTAEREVSELLVRHAGVDKIAFTGSTVAGRRIASICGERIARCTLELGGKSPAILLDDYDVATAAQSIASRAIFLTGQVCASRTRIIVSRSRHDALVEALSENFRNVKVGDPFDPATQMGPLAMRRHVAEALGRARDRVVHVFLVFETDMVAVADVKKRLEHSAHVQYAPPNLDGPGVPGFARQVLEMNVVETPRTSAQRLNGIDSAPCRVAHVDANADSLVILLDGGPNIER